MKAKGIVVDIDGQFAKVKCLRSSACSSCHNCEAKGTCHAELIFGEQTEDVFVHVDNRLNAKIGDSVELESSSARTLLASVILFVLPVIFASLSYLVCEALLLSSVVSSLILLCVLIVSFLVVAKITNKLAEQNIISYIVRILEESETEIERK